MEKIIIADGSAVFAAMLQAKLVPGVAVRCCDNSRDLLSMLNDSMPSLLVLDLSLPGCDGVELLCRISAMPNCPAIMATVNYVSDFLKSSLAAMGIGYLLLKPCNMDVAAERVREMLRFYAKNPIPEDLLIKLGICEKLTGASYIRYALPFLLEDPDLQLTKELYPAIGAKFGKNAQCVERSIRNAVHSAWEKHDGYIWQDYMKKGPDGRCSRPSNSEFFHMLLRMMQNVG